MTVPREGYDDTFFNPSGVILRTSMRPLQTLWTQGLLWMTNGPASILGEPIPLGVLSSSARLRPPPDPISVDELMPSSIPEAWSEEKTNALAVATALSAKRGVTLPWSSVQTAIESAIRTRWLEASSEGASWPTTWQALSMLCFRRLRPV